MLFQENSEKELWISKKTTTRKKFETGKSIQCNYWFSFCLRTRAEDDEVEGGHWVDVAAGWRKSFVIWSTVSRRNWYQRSILPSIQLRLFEMKINRLYFCNKLLPISIHCSSTTPFVHSLIQDEMGRETDRQTKELVSYLNTRATVHSSTHYGPPLCIHRQISFSEIKCFLSDWLWNELFWRNN